MCEPHQVRATKPREAEPVAGCKLKGATCSWDEIAGSLKVAGCGARRGAKSLRRITLRRACSELLQPVVYELDILGEVSWGVSQVSLVLRHGGFAILAAISDLGQVVIDWIFSRQSLLQNLVVALGLIEMAGIQVRLGTHEQSQIADLRGIVGFGLQHFGQRLNGFRKGLKLETSIAFVEQSDLVIGF